MGWRELLEEAAAWHGVTTPAQAGTHGVRARTYSRTVNEQAWPAPIGPTGPRLLPGTPQTAITRAAAALAHVGYPAALTRWSALHLLGVHRPEPPTTQLLLPARRAIPTVPGIDVLRSRLIRPAELHDVQGLCCATPSRILTDLASVTSPARLRSIAIDLRFRDDALLEQLHEAHEARRRYPGRRAVTAILAELWGDGSDSGFEFTTRDRLTNLGMRPDTQQAEVTTPTRTYHLDIAWRKLHVGVECVGWRYHRERHDQNRDALRHNDITSVDRWAILHLTWDMLVEPMWGRFTRQLAGLLERRSPRSAP